MDTDWEESPDGKGSIWNSQGLVYYHPLPPGKWEILEETESYSISRSPLGGVAKYSKVGSAIPQFIEPDLKPTREDWARFKSYLDPKDPQRWIPGWESRVASLNARQYATSFCAGSLFGWLRDRMGVEAISYLPYDDPSLYADMVGHMADFCLALNSQVLDKVKFDFGYFFEDCCYKNGPLLSPSLYREFYDQHYRRMTAAYREMGVPFLLLDSDGMVDHLLPYWLDSGIDILFPIEVGTWRANPVELRARHGKRLRMMGGVNKLVIPLGEAAIRAELEPLKPLVAEGGYIPMPDHRIPPDCSLEQFRTYLRVFKDVFGISPNLG
ncbi:MAG: hypothetical protein LV480_06095 [Methylacidiphilales bacterium]|nr:hypothetical protein [Candidatus Methylacidiphilales bacterium]